MFEEFTITHNDTILEALVKIDSNKQGFLIVIDDDHVVTGVITDGDIRRAMIRGYTSDQSIVDVYTKDPKVIGSNQGFDVVCDLFKNESVKFLPIVDKDGKLVNILTKAQMHALLLQDIHADLTYDFKELDIGIVDHEVFQRPWGFYKTTVLNDYYQAKVISVRPKERLSLQSHNHREEHWIVVHGDGEVQLDDSIVHVSCGSTVFIPKGCKHRLTNLDERENLIITEVQIGDYLGEDDIIRYEDQYGRV